MTQLVEVPADLLTPCLVAPILSVSSSQRLKPQVVVGRDSNLEISGTLASTAPAHHLLLQMPAFVGWRRLAARRWDRFGASTKPLLASVVKGGRSGGAGVVVVVVEQVGGKMPPHPVTLRAPHCQAYREYATNAKVAQCCQN